MRHLVRGRKLGRTAPHRTATMKALSVALIKEHRIVTTLAKAKELRRYVEPLITKAKEGSSHKRRLVFSKLNDKEAVSLLFNEVAQKAKDRPGGYTRVLKLGPRGGDGAEMAVVELVDYNDIKPEGSSKRKRTRRAGRSSSRGSSVSSSQTERSDDTRSSDVSAKKAEADKTSGSA